VQGHLRHDQFAFLDQPFSLRQSFESFLFRLSLNVHLLADLSLQIFLDDLRELLRLSNFDQTDPFEECLLLLHKVDLISRIHCGVQYLQVLSALFRILG
jgi:hypothetical protein